MFSLQDGFTFAFLEGEKNSDVLFVSNRNGDFLEHQTFIHSSDDAKSLTDEENVAESETESGDVTPLPRKTLLEYFLESKSTTSNRQKKGAPQRSGKSAAGKLSGEKMDIEHRPTMERIPTGSLKTMNARRNGIDAIWPWRGNRQLARMREVAEVAKTCDKRSVISKS